MSGTTSAAASSAATQTTATPAAQGTTAQATNAQAITALGSNLNDFLKMLMTQLQNQDPTQPLDSSQFTSQLVQFASVEQQVNANTNLTTLIQLQQGSEMVQAGALVGKQVVAQSSTLDLKNGSASLTLSPTTSEPVTVAITSPAGVALTTQTVQAAPGGTGWTWNGETDSGQSLPDGAYSVAVTDANGKAVPFGIAGTVASVQKSGSDVMLTLGNGQEVSYSSVQSTQ